VNEFFDVYVELLKQRLAAKRRESLAQQVKTSQDQLVFLTDKICLAKVHPFTTLVLLPELQPIGKSASVLPAIPLS